MVEQGLIKIINNDFGTTIPEKITHTELTEQLIVIINDFIKNNFEKLVAVLYRIDVDEDKLKVALKNNIDTDAAATIAKMIIKRQIEKIATLKQYGK